MKKTLDSILALEAVKSDGMKATLEYVYWLGANSALHQILAGDPSDAMLNTIMAAIEARGYAMEATQKCADLAKAYAAQKQAQQAFSN
jgi:hypothetical protein